MVSMICTLLLLLTLMLASRSMLRYGEALLARQEVWTNTLIQRNRSCCSMMVMTHFWELITKIATKKADFLNFLHHTLTCKLLSGSLKTSQSYRPPSGHLLIRL